MATVTTTPGRQTAAERAAELNIIVRKQRDGRMSVSRVPIPPMPAELKAIIEEMK